MDVSSKSEKSRATSDALKGPQAVSSQGQGEASKGLTQKPQVPYYPSPSSQGTQPPLTPRQGLDYRGRVPDASP